MRASSCRSRVTLEKAGGQEGPSGCVSTMLTSEYYADSEINSIVCTVGNTDDDFS